MFLNQNIQKSKAHRKEIERKKNSLKQLKDSLDLYKGNNQVTKKFSDCKKILMNSFNINKTDNPNEVTLDKG